MNVTDAILKRVSIRKYKSTPVEKEKIQRVLEAGRRAPSWGNVQPWRFIVTQDKDKKEKLANASAGQESLANAPVIIVCCGLKEAFSRKMQREALKQLVEVGAIPATDEIIDTVILESDMFAPYRLGEQVMTIRAGEQVMIAMAFMTLEAVNQGLGTVIVGATDVSLCHEAMNLPDNLFVSHLIPLGYPDEDPAPRPRKPFEKICFWEKYE